MFGRALKRSLHDRSARVISQAIPVDNSHLNGSPSSSSQQPGTVIPAKTPTQWRLHRMAVKKSFPQGWEPPKKLSREGMEALRDLHAADPSVFTTPLLAEKFRISPEAVRRILKSKFVPSEEKMAKMRQKEREGRDERQRHVLRKEIDDFIKMKVERMAHASGEVGEQRNKERNDYLPGRQTSRRGANGEFGLNRASLGPDNNSSHRPDNHQHAPLMKHRSQGTAEEDRLFFR